MWNGMCWNIIEIFLGIIWHVTNNAHLGYDCTQQLMLTDERAQPEDKLMSIQTVLPLRDNVRSAMQLARSPLQKGVAEKFQTSAGVVAAVAPPERRAKIMSARANALACRM